MTTTAKKPTEEEMHALRFPLGEFKYDPDMSEAKIAGWIDAIENTPAEVRRAVEGLSDAQLDTQYRPEGWTVRQVVHHLADSHANTHARIRLTLTENEPTIRCYDEKAWAELPDARSGPLEPSLLLLEGIHARLVALLRTLDKGDYKRKLMHPEMGPQTLGGLLQFYAWHGRHHVAHVTRLREREGWN